MLHSFRFFGLVFPLAGVAGPDLPAAFATFAAYGDLATGVLAILALLTARARPLFWLFVVAFNVVGAVDIRVDNDHGNAVDVATLAGELGTSLLAHQITTFNASACGLVVHAVVAAVAYWISRASVFVCQHGSSAGQQANLQTTTQISDIDKVQDRRSELHLSSEI